MVSARLMAACEEARESPVGDASEGAGAGQGSPAVEGYDWTVIVTGVTTHGHPPQAGRSKGQLLRQLEAGRPNSYAAMGHLNPSLRIC